MHTHAEQRASNSCNRLLSSCGHKHGQRLVTAAQHPTFLRSQSGCLTLGTGLGTRCIAAGMVMIFWMALPSRSLHEPQQIAVLKQLGRGYMSVLSRNMQSRRVCLHASSGCMPHGGILNSLPRDKC